MEQEFLTLDDLSKMKKQNDRDQQRKENQLQNNNRKQQIQNQRRNRQNYQNNNNNIRSNYYNNNQRQPYNNNNNNRQRRNQNNNNNDSYNRGLTHQYNSKEKQRDQKNQHIQDWIGELDIQVSDDDVGNQEEMVHIDLESAEKLKIRENAIHVFGVDFVSTTGILECFKDQNAKSIEWLNDSSCNVVFEKKEEVDRVFKELIEIKFDDENEDEEDEDKKLKKQSENEDEKNEIDQEQQENNEDNEEEEQPKLQSDLEQIRQDQLKKRLNFISIRPFQFRNKKVTLRIRMATNQDIKKWAVQGKNSKYFGRFLKAVSEKSKKIKKEQIDLKKVDKKENSEEQQQNEVGDEIQNEGENQQNRSQSKSISRSRSKSNQKNQKNSRSSSVNSNNSSGSNI